MKTMEDPDDGVVVKNAAFDLTRGAEQARNTATWNDCDMEAAVEALIDMLGRARWCERAPHRDPEDLDNLGSINPADFAAEWPWVRERFRYFYERSYEQVESAADQIEAAIDALRSHNMSYLSQVADFTIEWSGDARDAFVLEFIGPLAGTAISEQQRLLAELQAALWAYDALLRRARVNAYDLADKTTDVLASLTETSPDEAKVQISILAVVVSVLTVIETGGTSSAIALGLMSSALNTATTGVDAHAIISGDTTSDVMNSLKEALDNLTIEMNASEQAIADALSKTQTYVEADLRNTHQSNLVPFERDSRCPDITEGEFPSKEDFHQKK